MLPEARHAVLPKGIASSSFPRVRETCRRIGVEFDSWQVDLNRCILAKTSDGLYAADTVVLSIARQVGKTFDVGAVIFALCIADPGTTVVWTAHRFKVARETFTELRSLAKSPKLAPHIDYDEITTGAGNETIPFRNGSRIVFAARERGAIRGFTKVSALILDEAQILTHAALADLAPTMNQAANPLIILMGTPPKPTDPGEVFTELRSDALGGVSSGVLYVEFSADPEADLDDRKQWAKANPSFPSRTPARAILRLRKLLSDDDFRREALGIWDDESASRGAFPLERWSALADPDAERGGSVSFGVATAPDRSWAAVAVAWRRPDGGVQVMLTDYHETTAWVGDRVRELRASWGGQVRAAKAALDLVPDSTDEPQSRADNAFADLVTAGTVRHGNQPALNVAVRSARWRPSGDSRVLDQRGSADISPLIAAAQAVYGLMNQSTSGWMVGV